MADGSQPANPRSAPAEVWERARDDYRGGLPAHEVCRRHGVGLTSLRNRAARERWRRTDLPWIPPNVLDPRDEGVELEARVGGDLDQVALGELSLVAFRRMMRAVLRGHAAEALRWRKLSLVLEADHDQVEREIEQEAQIRHMSGLDAGPSREAIQAELKAAREVLKRWREADAPDRPDRGPADGVNPVD
ncbi:MAG: hypothetical protein Q8S03_09455 [Brevundimonas sp.]|uniref:hypothetical protein n=1 Tax=Brevundimonas sp. TaxID=1871086 RepID=UPI002737406F|nr:hypothetical protein [Brevundimonas sp.]MDP3404905.1 hypothetical protein [Brevundimonas sp.]